jgi:large subunit ribosomal protein L3
MVMSAVQLGFDDATEKSATKADLGHAKKAGTSVKRKIVEFKGFEEEYKLGDAITVEHFTEGESLLMYLVYQKEKVFKAL